MAPAGDTVKLSVPGDELFVRDDFVMCRLCHWGRGSGRCPHA